MYSDGIYNPGGEREKTWTKRAETGFQMNR